MKRAHLKWLIPVIIYIVALIAILLVYRNTVYENAAMNKQKQIAIAVEQEVRAIDISLDNAITAVNTTGKALSLYSMNYNKNQIKSLLKNLVDETQVEYAFVCNADGKGYDYLGDEISIGSEPYFKDVVYEYSQGGTGMMLSSGGDSASSNHCYILSGIVFDKKEIGFIISELPIVSLSDQLFRERYILDKVAIITMNGDILASDNVFVPEGEMAHSSFWDMLPIEVSKDTIKLSISQKNLYSSRIPGYGYLIISPLSSASGGAAVLVNEAGMKIMVQDVMAQYDRAVSAIFVTSLLLIVLIVISFIVSDRVEANINEKKRLSRQKDELTGLLGVDAAVEEISSYIDGSGHKRGIMFLLELTDTQKGRSSRGDAFIDEKIKEFAISLEKSFRSTDVLARMDDGKFLVFLKDIHESKDIRRQTDHMQMFLHDTRFLDDAEEVGASAGAALYPDNGATAVEIIEAAEQALKKSVAGGKGRLVFYS
jgi:GGDEF domain-containing protein